MEFWLEFLASSGRREFVVGGVGGMAGVLAGQPPNPPQFPSPTNNNYPSPLTIACPPCRI
jgi:hypothetical protein